jgi:hypothetical protein
MYSVLAVEAVVIAVLHNAQMAGAWELRIALTRLVPIAGIAFEPAAIGGWLVLELLELVDGWGRWALTGCNHCRDEDRAVTGGRHFRDWMLARRSCWCSRSLRRSPWVVIVPRLKRFRERYNGVAHASPP